jgi:copper transport protein
VLGVSGVLVDGIPPVSAASGPFSKSSRLGPLDLEVTIDPARAGGNEMHVYLFNVKSGAPFTGTKQITATASLKARQIGPLPITLRRSGDGHFTADTVQLAPAGKWAVAITDRVSDFDEYTTTMEVSIR